MRLREGENAFELVAVNDAGAAGRREIIVQLDTVTPRAVDVGLIVFGPVVGGEVSVTGAARAVEAGAAVRVTNRRSAASVTVPSRADGSFSARLAAQVADRLLLVAVDAAENASPGIRDPSGGRSRAGR